MNKLYSLLITAVICSAASGLIASEEPAKQPFFDQKTQDAVKKTAKYYALGYAGIYAAGIVGAFVSNTFIPAEYKGRPVKSRGISIGTLARSIPYTAPIALLVCDKIDSNPGAVLKDYKESLSLAYHKCEESLSLAYHKCEESLSLAYHKYQANPSEKNAA